MLIPRIFPGYYLLLTNITPDFILAETTRTQLSIEIAPVRLLTSNLAMTGLKNQVKE